MTIQEAKNLMESIYLAPHASPSGVTFEEPRCGDCWCEIQKVHTHLDSFTEKLIEASRLIAASEQRERCVQIIKHSIEGYQNELGENDYVSLEELKEAQIDQILNQEAQQALSNNQK